MKKVVKLLVVALLALSIFCVSAMAAGTDDAQLNYVVRDDVKYIGSNPVSWCTFYTAANGSGKVIYSYTDVDLNGDSNTDVCDLVKVNKDSVDFDFDGLFAASDLDLMRDIIFNPAHSHETQLDTFQLQMKAEAEAAGAPYEKLNRQLVWHDEFDGGALNTNNWEFENTMYNANHKHINDAEHVFVANGNLTLKATVEDGVYAMPEGLATTNNMLFKYGYLEMKAMVPYQTGAWPSFWAKSTTIPALKQSTNSMEVDFMEAWSSVNSFSANLIKWRANGSEKLAVPTGGWGWPDTSYTFKNASNLKNEYHTYGFEWDPDNMTIYVDDTKVVTFAISGEKAKFKNWYGYSSFPEADMFQDYLRILINNECFAPGDEYDSYGTLTETATYSIDYVRLYQNRDDAEDFKTTDEIAAIK